jgi:hypothetical protein
MRIYFGKGTEIQSYLGYENEKRQRILNNNAAKCWLDTKLLAKNERFKTMKSFSCVKCIFGKNCPEINNCEAFAELDRWEAEKKFDQDVNQTLWYKICKSTKKICGGDFIGTIVFWFAFFIETEVKIELLKRGKKVYNVYDGFYYNQDISAEIAQILKEKSLFVYDEFMKKIKII